jgi:signal transduction histidine kinase
MLATDKITPEAGWLLQRERLVAWLRVGFAALAILVVQLNPDRIARFPTLSLISLGLFFLYSVVVLYVAQRHALTSKSADLVTTVLDVVCVAVMVFSTGGTRTPFFFYYSFPVITASLRWGITGSVLVAIAAVTTYVVIRITLAAEAMAEPIEIDTIIVRTFYLVVLAYVFGYVSEFERNQNRRLIALSKTAVEAAASEERRRIIYELHDGILQSLATLLLRLEGCRAALPNPQDGLGAEMASMQTLTRTSMKQIREFLSGKDPEPIVAGTLSDRLRDELKFLQSALGLEVTLESEPEDPDLPSNIEREIYYVIREGLTNVTRHSHASRVEIRFKQSAKEFAAMLSDNGVGFNRRNEKTSYGVGLAAMEARIKKIGGRLSVESVPGLGTKISFVVPLVESRNTKPSASSRTITRLWPE